MHTHTQSAYTGFTHARAPMLTPNVCTRVCACTQRALAEATPQSEQGEGPGDAGITAVFSFPVKHPGLLQNIHSPLTLPSSGPPFLSLPGLLPFRLE